MTDQSLVIHFELPKPFPLLNRQMRKHWGQRAKEQAALAWEVRAAIAGPLPPQPWAKAKLRIERHSIGEPDRDGLYGGCKSLVDILCWQGNPVRVKGRDGKPDKIRLPHPSGLGIIRDDNPRCLSLDVVAVRVSKRAYQRTVVTIERVEP